MENEEAILAGEEQKALIESIPEKAKNAYETCSKFATTTIYRSKDVLDIELAGYRIIGFLLEKFIHAVQTPSHGLLATSVGKDTRSVRNRFTVDVWKNPIDNRLCLGMTDLYALDLYR